nr:YbaK/EbsC family protein [Anaerolineae bacterium]
MAVPKKIINFLEKSKVKYQILKHRKVYTAFDKSQTLKVPQKIVGKTLILRDGKKLIFVLISADKKLDLRKIKNLRKIKKLGKKVELAREKLIKNKIKGVKVGAVPPFGILWKAQTIVDPAFKRQKEIILNSGDWQHSIKISPKNLEKLVPDLVWQKISQKR